MNRYDDLIKAMNRTGVAQEVTPVPPDRLRQLVKEIPDLPADYLDFLKEVGFGSFADGGFTVFEGPVSADSIFDETTAKDFEKLLFFGTDAQGYCAAFDPATAWRVVEVDPTDMGVSTASPAFESFIRRRIAEI